MNSLGVQLTNYRSIALGDNGSTPFASNSADGKRVTLAATSLFSRNGRFSVVTHRVAAYREGERLILGEFGRRVFYVKKNREKGDLKWKRVLMSSLLL